MREFDTNDYTGLAGSFVPVRMIARGVGQRIVRIRVIAPDIISKILSSQQNGWRYTKLGET